MMVKCYCCYSPVSWTLQHFRFILFSLRRWYFKSMRQYWRLKGAPERRSLLYIVKVKKWCATYGEHGRKKGIQQLTSACWYFKSMIQYWRLKSTPEQWSALYIVKLKKQCTTYGEYGRKKGIQQLTSTCSLQLSFCTFCRRRWCFRDWLGRFSVVWIEVEFKASGRSCRGCCRKTGWEYKEYYDVLRIHALTRES